MFALSFAIGQAVLPPQDRAETNAAQVILSVVLLVIAGTAAIAAGWSAVWSFKDRKAGSREPTDD
ncbi:MAG: hypothetical protein ACR2JN_09950 [Lapillicoccus sp.]